MEQSNDVRSEGSSSPVTPLQFDELPPFDELKHLGILPQGGRHVKLRGIRQ